MQVQRFNFKEFDGHVPAGKGAVAKNFLPTGRSREDAPPPPPTYKEEDVKAAEREGYKKGFLEGQQDGHKQAQTEQAEIDRKLSELFDGFAKGISALFADGSQLAAEIRQEMPKVAFTIARKVAGEALEKNAVGIIGDMALRCCETMVNEPKFTITVHESLGDTLEKRLKDLGAKLPATAEIIIQRSPELPLSDCRIEWTHGGMERNTAQMWQQIEKIVGFTNPVGRDSGSTGSNEAISQPDPAQSPSDSQDLKKE